MPIAEELINNSAIKLWNYGAIGAVLVISFVFIFFIGRWFLKHLDQIISQHREERKELIMVIDRQSSEHRKMSDRQQDELVKLIGDNNIALNGLTVAMSQLKENMANNCFRSRPS